MMAVQHAAHKRASLEVQSAINGDVYTGSAAQLIEAGIVTEGQLPGAPGMPGLSVCFVNGVQQPKGARNPHDEAWMQVSKYGKKFRVTRGLSATESQRRKEAEQAAFKEAQRNRPKQDNGLAGTLAETAHIGALFAVGDCVMAGGYAASVTGAYELRTVVSEDGEFQRVDGKRVDYRWGYVCRLMDGGEFFFAAHQVKTEQHPIAHLRLVRSKTSMPKTKQAEVWPIAIVQREIPR